MSRRGPFLRPMGGAKGWLSFAVLLLACFMYAFTLQVVNLAVPEITIALKPDAAELLWIIDIYGFVLAGLVMPMGALSDRFGHRRLLLIGTTVFAVASICAALSPSPEVLIASRALLGVGAAAVAPSTMALVFSIFQRPADAAFAIALWTTAFAVGTASGPAIGGVMLTVAPWGAVFMPAVLIAAVVLALGPFVLPERRDATPRPFDFAGALLSLLAVLGIVYGFKELVASDFDLDALIVTGTGVLLAIVFVVRQRTAKHPMLPRVLLHNRYVLGSLAGYLAVALANFGFQYFVPQYVTLVLGSGTVTAGLVMVAASIGSFLGSMIAAALARRFPVQPIMIIGLLICALSASQYTQLTASSSPWSAAALLFANGVAGTLVFISANRIIMGAAPPDARGAASGIAEMSGELGAALGIAVLGGLGGLAYRTSLADGLGDAVSAAVLAQAQEGIASAQSVTADATLQELISAAARIAFMDELHTAAACAATTVLVVATGLCVVFWARTSRASRTAKAVADE